MAFFGDLVVLSCHKNTDAWARLSDSTATTSSSFLFLVFLALFLRKIRDLQQRFATDAAYHFSKQRHFPVNLSWSFSEGVFSLFFGFNREINREFFVF